jgi:hypothetical protein
MQVTFRARSPESHRWSHFRSLYFGLIPGRHSLTQQTGTGDGDWCRVPGPGGGTLIATFSPAEALQTEQGKASDTERTVFSCDYNGWADVPEEEREGLDSFEAARLLPPRALLPAPVIRVPIASIPVITHRRAA